MLVSNYRDGEIDGMKKGEKAKAIDVAKKLKSLGVATEIIQQSTGLSEDEIEKARY
jgi:predicted transposase/invertase (TIGR01784 family)